MTIRETAVAARNNRYGLTRDAGILYRGLNAIGMRAAVLDRRERPFMDRLSGSSEFPQSLGAKARSRFEDIDRSFAVRLGVVFGPPGAAEPSRRGHDEFADA